MYILHVVGNITLQTTSFNVKPIPELSRAQGLRDRRGGRWACNTVYGTPTNLLPLPACLSGELATHSMTGLDLSLINQVIILLGHMMTYKYEALFIDSCLGLFSLLQLLNIL